MVRVTALCAAFFLVFQVHLKAELDPVQEFIQSHDSIAVEYTLVSSVNNCEETIELKRAGQSVVATNFQGKKFICISGSSGQENMRIVTQNIEEIWVFLQNVVNKLRKESLTRYENDENIEAILFNEAFDCNLNGHTGHYKRVSLIDKHRNKHLIGRWHSEQCSDGMRKTLFIGNDTYSCSYEEIKNHSLNQRPFISFCSAILHHDFADHELQYASAEIEKWRNKASRLHYQRHFFKENNNHAGITVFKDKETGGCLGSIFWDADSSGLIRVGLFGVSGPFGKMSLFDDETIHLTLLQEMVKDLKSGECATTIVIDNIDKDDLSLFDGLGAVEEGKDSYGRYWMKYDIARMEQALQQLIDRLIEKAFIVN